MIRKKRKKGLRKKGGGGENSPISPPLDPRLRCLIVLLIFFLEESEGRSESAFYVSY